MKKKVFILIFGLLFVGFFCGLLSCKIYKSHRLFAFVCFIRKLGSEVASWNAFM